MLGLNKHLFIYLNSYLRIILRIEVKMCAILRIFLRLSVILRKILRIFVNTDFGICEQKVRNF